jgi:hypothetical protein
MTAGPSERTQERFRLVAYRLPRYTGQTLRPGRVARDWMDESRERFAYRCLPLNIANAHGWEVATPPRRVEGSENAADLLPGGRRGHAAARVRRSTETPGRRARVVSFGLN